MKRARSRCPRSCRRDWDGRRCACRAPRGPGAGGRSLRSRRQTTPRAAQRRAENEPTSASTCGATSAPLIGALPPGSPSGRAGGRTSGGRSRSWRCIAREVKPTCDRPGSPPPLGGRLRRGAATAYASPLASALGHCSEGPGIECGHARPRAAPRRSPGAVGAARRARQRKPGWKLSSSPPKCITAFCPVASVIRPEGSQVAALVADQQTAVTAVHAFSVERSVPVNRMTTPWAEPSSSSAPARSSVPKTAAHKGVGAQVPGSRLEQRRPNPLVHEPAERAAADPASPAEQQCHAMRHRDVETLAASFSSGPG